MPTQPELLKQARDRGIGEDVLADDATKASIQEALDGLGPAPSDAARNISPPEEEVERFPVERVIKDAEQFFGIASHVLAGALHGYDGNTITLDQAREAVDNWNASVVHVGEDQEA